MALTEAEAAELALLREDYAAVRVAMRAILTGAQSYSLDTSQTRQSVTKADLGSLRTLRTALQSDIDELEARDSGAQVVYARPGF